MTSESAWRGLPAELSAALLRAASSAALGLARSRARSSPSAASSSPRKPLASLEVSASELRASAVGTCSSS